MGDLQEELGLQFKCSKVQEKTLFLLQDTHFFKEEAWFEREGKRVSCNLSKA